MSNVLRTVEIDITSLLIPEHVAIIKATCREYAKSYDIFTRLVCDMKTTEANKLYKAGYRLVSETVPLLPTAMIISSSRHACASVKSFNSNVKRRNKQITAKNERRTKYLESHQSEEDVVSCQPKPLLKEWEYTGHHHCKTYKLNTASISRLEDKGITSIGSITGRIKVRHQIPEWFAKKYPNRRLFSGQVTCDEYDRVTLYLTFALLDENGKDIITHAQPKVEREKYNKETVVGIDRGIYHPVAASNGLLISSKDYYAPSRRYAYDVTTLKQKSTPSARSRLRSLGKREKRYNRDVNHRISKIIANIPAACIVLEDLTGISQNRHKSRKFTKFLHKWSFLDLEEKIKYKCELAGIRIKYVNPYYTSSICSECHELIPEARKGNRFKCPKCGHIEHADINAAKNIRDRYLVNLRNSPRVHSTTHDVPVESD